MRKIKKIILSTFILCLFFINVSVEVDASSGKLRSASICQGPDGTYYGQHSSDNHWHVAKHYSSGWYPQGSIVSGNPCGGTSAPSTNSNSNGSSTNSNSSGSSSNSNSSSYNNNYSNSNSSSSNYNNVKTTPEVKKTNEKPEIKAIDFKQIKENEIDSYLSKDDILDLFNVSVSDLEDGDISNDDIIVNPQKILKDDIGTHDISISYEDKDGNKVEKEVELEIKEDGKPQIKLSIKGEITISNYEIPKSIEDFIDLVGLEVTDLEDGNIDVSEDNISLNKKEHNVLLSFEDSDGNKISKEIEYHIKENTSLDFVLSLAVVVLIGYGIYSFYKSKKNN